MNAIHANGNAHGCYDPLNNRITLLAGSSLAIDPDNPNPPSNIAQNYRQANEEIKKGTIKYIDGTLTVVEDIPGLSLSAAHVIVSGQPGRGPQNWLNEEGTPIGDGPTREGGSNEELPSDKNLRLLEVLRTCLQAPFGAAPFDDLYQRLSETFDSQAISLEADVARNLKWPKNAGVYAVWEREPNGKLLYVGMTGKFTTLGQLSPKQGLHDRKARWDPYRFQESLFEFGFIKDKNDPNARNYKYSKPLKTLRIDCFIVNREGIAAPAFLEAILLQAHLEQFKKLPQGNNAF